jgi:hypothetical protein
VLSLISLVATLNATPAPAIVYGGRDVRPRRDVSTAPTNGKELIKAMRERYPDWYTTLTFVQKTTDLRKNTVETWYEAARVPGMLRIDIAPIDSGKVILFRNDSIYQFGGGALKASQPFVHPLMVLGFDVYRDPAERTVARLEGLGYDLSRLREDSWQGRPVYVVGAAAGDTTSRQFWIDKERLLFVRSLETAKSGALSETLFNKYVPLGKGWIAPEVIFNVNGKTVIREEYSEMKADMKLPDALFDGSAYGKPAWVGKGER